MQFRDPFSNYYKQDRIVFSLFFSMQFHFVFLFLFSFFTWNGLNVDFRSNIISDIILNAIGIGIEIELAFGNR